MSAVIEINGGCPICKEKMLASYQDADGHYVANCPNGHSKIRVKMQCEIVDYEYQGNVYTPEEWQRVLKLKAFL